MTPDVRNFLTLYLSLSNYIVSPSHRHLDVAFSMTSEYGEAARQCNEQRRPKFTDTLQEIAQERCVVADKITTLVPVGGTSLSREEKGLSKPLDNDLPKQPKLQQPLATNAICMPRQSCIFPGGTSVTMANSLPIDPSRYAFMPISMSLSPLQQQSEHDSCHHSPINELLRMTSQLPEPLGTIPPCRYTQSSSMSSAKCDRYAYAQSVSISQSSGHTLTIGTLVNTNNVRKFEGRDTHLIMSCSNTSLNAK